MAITTLDGLIAGSNRTNTWYKQGLRTTVASTWYTLLDVAGNPGAGVLAGTSTTAGVVPTDATDGFPSLVPAWAGGTGYLISVDFGWNVAGRFRIYDLLFKAGPYNFNSNQALSAQPSFADRVPGGPDYSSLQLWYEQVTLGTGTQAVVVQFQDENNTARTNASFSIGAAVPVGRMVQLPLLTPAKGIQRVNNVLGTGATGGTFNILVMRRLWSGRCKVVNDGSTDGPSRTGMPTVYETSALYPIISTDSTSSGTPELQIGLTVG